MALARNFSGSSKASCWWPIPSFAKIRQCVQKISYFSTRFKMADMGKLGISRHDAPNLKRPVLWFWPNHSEDIRKNMHFSYLLTTRRDSAETLQVVSSHACYNTHQIWSQYAKLLRRYSLRSIFACFSQNSCARYSGTVWLIDLNSITFCQKGL